MQQKLARTPRIKRKAGDNNASTCFSRAIRLRELLPAICLILGFFSAQMAGAASNNIETLIMPGPVTEAHAEIESDCSQCHTRFNRDTQRALCTTCHEEVATDQSTSRGFHGLDPTASSADCKSCHGEHLGRNSDIVGLTPELFDHSNTNFALTGSHQNETCSACHDAGSKHREANTTCISCHSDDDQHSGGLGKTCESCHKTSTWAETTFDHSKDTDFELTGKHSAARCAACHVNQTYEDTKSTCISCHKTDDVHSGSRGTECAACHTTQEWQTADFDHAKETGFSLMGAHRQLVCSNCHLMDMALPTPATTCVGCHGATDPHLARNGSECSTCHNESNWDTSFNHLEQTDFALVGKHASLECTQCHQGALTDPLPTTCEDCHGSTDPHSGGLPKCASCHNETGWRSNIDFHHDLTNFPLLGGHKLASCDQCHNGLQFVTENTSDGQCIDCHSDNDHHKGSLGDDCGICHSPVAWELWAFDHTTQADYDLTGAHENLICSACHTPERGQQPEKLCGSCHRQDDVHNGSFGVACERCHSTTTFANPKVGRSR